MRLVFAGTPQAAVPALDALLGSRHEVAAVITRPDAPAGRGSRDTGRRVTPSPVAVRARDAGIEVLTPGGPATRPSSSGSARSARTAAPSSRTARCCPGSRSTSRAQGWVNLHFSLLPAWRGAAPVQHAILHGDDITGATTFRLVEELDAGPVFGVVTEPIRPEDTAGDLLGRLAVVGARLLVITLDGIESGQLEAQPQPADGVSLAPKITPEDARVDWTRSAVAVDRLIRAATPQPGAWTVLGGTRVKLGPVVPTGGEAAPGELRVTRDQVLVGTGTRPVALGDVRPEGKRPMRAIEWVRGLRLRGGERLG